MDSIEFGKLCREYNKVYRDMFGSIPVPSDYSCSRSDFLEALKKSVDEKQPIETYIAKRLHPNDGRLE